MNYTKGQSTLCISMKANKKIQPTQKSTQLKGSVKMTKNLEFLSYDPGIIPKKPSLKVEDKIEIVVEGYPPYKDSSRSIRNIRHKYYERFVNLREEAIKIMGGRAWTHQAIGMYVEIHAPDFEKNKTLTDYCGGIADTLDGSSGYTFTYLPIVFEDDCQICKSSAKFIHDENIWYKIKIEILNQIKEKS